MKIALLKENKNEYRVSLVPADVKKLADNKHTVTFTKQIGINAGFDDEQYIKAGAKLVKNNKTCINGADFVFKLSSLTPSEIKLIKQNQIIISFFNMSNHPKVLFNLLKNKNTSLALDAINEEGLYPAVIPNEQIKGKFSVILSTYYLSKFNKDSLGKFFSNVNYSQDATNFVIVHASYAGLEAARTALAIGSNVIMLENNDDLIKQVQEDKGLVELAKLNHNHFKILKASFNDLTKYIANADVLINTNSLPNSSTQKRITIQMIQSMKKGTVYINLASDQGPASDTEKKIATINKPIYLSNGVIHFNIDNIPSLFSNTASTITSNIISRYILENIHNSNDA
jgi:alanine dehydrogenase